MHLLQDKSFSSFSFHSSDLPLDNKKNSQTFQNRKRDHISIYSTFFSITICLCLQHINPNIQLYEPKLIDPTHGPTHLIHYVKNKSNNTCDFKLNRLYYNNMNFKQYQIIIQQVLTKQKYPINRNPIQKILQKIPMFNRISNDP